MGIISINNLKQAWSFAAFYMKAGNEHDVHSPFVFKLLTEAIYSRQHADAFDKIEIIRQNLLNNKNKIEVTDLGAGSSFDGRLQKRSISEIASKFSKPPRYCRLLYRLTGYLKPELMIELGTSLGISAMYQSAGNPNGLLYTLEGCEQTASCAVENFKNAGFKNIHCITGNFDLTFPKLLSEKHKVDYIFIDGNHTYDATMRYFHIAKSHIHEKSVIVFDDINWSDGMKKAWKEIKADQAVTISIDFFMLGMVFFNKGFTKQDFVLKLR